jgi:hypothetical protein
MVLRPDVKAAINYLPAIWARDRQKVFSIYIGHSLGSTLISDKIEDKEDRTSAQKRVGLGAIFGSYK